MNLHRLDFHNGGGFALIDEYKADSQIASYVDPPYTKAAKRLYRNQQVDMATVSGSFLMNYSNEKKISDLTFAHEKYVPCRNDRV